MKNHPHFTLENQFLRISIHPKGAEIQSVVDVNDHTEYMWQADSDVWGRHAPVLFPIVGRLKNNSYSWKGKTYSMKQHGFARDHIFSGAHDVSSAVFTLEANEETRLLYPFDFQLKIHYMLSERQLTVTYEVDNTGEEVLPFTIGAHPGFTCPIKTGEQLTDYVVVFDQEEYAVKHLLDDGLFNGSMKPVLKHEKTIAIDQHSFEEDAIVLHNLNSNYIKLLSTKSGKYIGMDISDFPYLGIWAKPGAPFVCLEPWHGLADYTDATGQWEDKKGMIFLKAGERFKTSYKIDFH